MNADDGEDAEMNYELKLSVNGTACMGRKGLTSRCGIACQSNSRKGAVSYRASQYPTEDTKASTDHRSSELIHALCISQHLPAKVYEVLGLCSNATLPLNDVLQLSDTGASESSRQARQTYLALKGRLTS
jgi:hypothetical protein